MNLGSTSANLEELGILLEPTSNETAITRNRNSTLK